MAPAIDPAADPAADPALAVAAAAAVPAVDDPDEATLADPLEPEDEPTTIRPTPLPPGMMPWDGAAAQPAEPPRPAPPRVVGKYELQTRLARGAFGVVYTARDPSLERQVAIKVLHPSHLANAEIVQRFVQEARTTARIAHPGIVTIHDCGTVETRRGSTAYIAMELLSGESLTARLARTARLDPAVACEIARQVASALEAAHHVAVLHRDLKPDNIYLVPDPAMPSGERVKVLDFGLAKLGTSGHTQLQTVFGTPRYMSPEQGRSATQIDHRSDIYSLGCVLFELITGCTPFDGDARQLIDRHQRTAPPRASLIATGLPRILDQLIADMLAKDPMDRPQTMGAVQRTLRQAVADLADGDPPTERSEPPAAALASSRRSSQRITAARGSVPPPLLASIEVSVTPVPVGPLPITPLPPAEPSAELLRPSRPPRMPSMYDGTISGELVVPAPLAAEPPPALPVEPSSRRQRVFWLCAVAVVALTTIALAAL